MDFIANFIASLKAIFYKNKKSKLKSKNPKRQNKIKRFSPAVSSLHRSKKKFGPLRKVSDRLSKVNNFKLSKNRVKNRLSIPARQSSVLEKKRLLLRGSIGNLQPAEVKVGEITHFFSKIMVCVIKINRKEIRVGDRVHIKGQGTDFTQEVKSLQIESINVKSARQGQLVGLNADKIAKVGDFVFK